MPSTIVPTRFLHFFALLLIWGATTGGIPALVLLDGLCVAGMVGITGLRVGWMAVLQLTDTQELELKKSIEKAVNRAIVKYQLQDDVLGVPSVRARFLGSRAWVDLEVETNPLRSTSAATQVVKVLRNTILSKIPCVQDVAIVVKAQGVDDDTSKVVNGQPQLLSSEGKNDNDTAKLSSKTTDATSNAALTPMQVEERVRSTLQSSRAFAPDDSGTEKRLDAVRNVLVHFSSPTSKGGRQCDVDIIVSADESTNLSLKAFKNLAEIVKRDVIRNTEGVVDAKVSLELVRKDHEDEDDGDLAASSSNSTEIA